MYMIKLTLGIVDAFSEARQGPIAALRRPDAIGFTADPDSEAHSSYLAFAWAPPKQPPTADPTARDQASRRVA